MEFLLKSSLCMLVLLAIYHLFLEREKMHWFNRFYLLTALIISLAAPFITIEVDSNKIIKPVAATAMALERATIVPSQNIAALPSTNYIITTVWLLYGIVTFLMLIKFIKNINHFIRKANKNPIIKYESATLVLVPEKTLPHTFLNYIFVNREDHEKNTIENELYAHELTHVRQKHTIDILFVELLKIALWFNPLLYFYKKAIQLNHEFLADEKVVSSFDNAVFYQKLLLEKAAIGNPFYLASNLNFSITKQRLLMMTKSTSKTKSTILKVGLIPVVIGLITFLSLKNSNDTETTNKAHYNKYTEFRYTASNGEVIVKKFNDLTEKEKQALLSPPAKPELNHPTLNQWNEWKSNKNISIWIDNQEIERGDLDNFNPNELYFFDGPVNQEANNKNTKPQVILYTKQGFENQYNSLEWPKPIEYKYIAKYRPANDC
ncbi:BlaR1 peptidase M56 [compost metagenome]